MYSRLMAPLTLLDCSCSLVLLSSTGQYNIYLKLLIELCHVVLTHGMLVMQQEGLG